MKYEQYYEFEEEGFADRSNIVLLEII